MKRKNRAAPKSGYLDPRKMHYRRELYSFVETCLSHIPLRERIAVIFDTRDAGESEFLIRRGYDSRNIIAVNRAPVEVSMLTQKLDSWWLPRVETHGIEMLRVLKQLQTEERYPHSINLDLTGPAGPDTIDLVEECRNRALGTEAVVAITMLKGREHGSNMIRLFWDMGECPDRVLARLFMVVTAMKGPLGERAIGCYFHPVRLRYNEYRSGTQTMLWVAVHLRHHDLDVVTPDWRTRAGLQNAVDHYKRLLAPTCSLVPFLNFREAFRELEKFNPQLGGVLLRTWWEKIEEDARTRTVDCKDGMMFGMSNSYTSQVRSDKDMAQRRGLMERVKDKESVDEWFDECLNRKPST